ncbi:MAG: RNA methyltransferase [Planctomycetota bacterium]|nr:RNA methyltransferase [Planctomycetota bacterium]
MEHLEGRQSILAALAARQRRFEVILVDHGAHEQKVREVLDAAEALGVPVKRVAGRELDAIAHGASHGGVLAVCSAKPRMSCEELIDLVKNSAQPALLLLIEGIEDARNLGFTLRSAEALGAGAVLIKKHLWDFDAVEVARPASGAYERLPLVQIEGVEVLQQLQRGGMQLLGCIAGTRRTIHEMDLIQPVILAIGGEKRGLSGAVRSICDALVTIPTVAGAASLPLSHAAAVVLAEAHRQRLLATGGRLRQNSDSATAV